MKISLNLIKVESTLYKNSKKLKGKTIIIL